MAKKGGYVRRLKDEEYRGYTISCRKTNSGMVQCAGGWTGSSVAKTKKKALDMQKSKIRRKYK